ATPRQAELSTLNLEAANVRCVDGWVTVTPTLRTTHSRIYACGEAIAPLSNASTAREQVEIAVKNALFCATRRWGDRPHPSLIRTVPPCGRVGLTEDQANHRFNRKVVKLTVSLQTEQPGVTDNPMWTSQEASFLAVIVHHRGAIVGAQCVGEAAEELLALFSVAIDQGWSIARLCSAQGAFFVRSSANPSGFCADVLHRLLLKWQAKSVNINPMKRNVLELLMNWQRDWSRG
ncbi:MAG: hypothetical protein VKL39_14165, partial [Leptolyngbyaceae bacterium]|nr:hypothetical protein [Leptolyngbyaceae bacterium]